VPGVRAAGISQWILFGGVPSFPSDPSPGQMHVVRLCFVSPGFLQALGMRLLKGRWLSQDEPGPAMLLNESLARRAFGDANPLGLVLSVPQATTVVGVVADLRYSKLDAEPEPEAYLLYGQRPPVLRGGQVAIRTAGDPRGLTPALRKMISEIDPTQPVFGVETLEQALADSIAPRRFNLFLLGTFAAVALLLALVGIYGVMAYSVAERTREIGVRLALGAQSGQVVRLVVREGLATAVAGIAAGLAAAWGLTRLMADLLYGVKPHDPWTFAAVALALTATALLACGMPALRAARVDPVVALRDE